MNRRRGLVFIVAAFASVAFLDVTLWLFATRALRQGVQTWTEHLRANGVDVTLAPLVSGGWPATASVRFDARLGPGGLPQGAVLDTTLTAVLSPLRPRTVRTEVERATIAAATGGRLSATATDWVIDAPMQAPDQATTTAHRLLLAWAGHDARIETLIGAMAPGAQGGIRVAMQASGLDLAASGIALPASTGTFVRSLHLDAIVFGGLPRPAATAAASARAWQQDGGRIEVSRLDGSYGPLDVALDARLTLNEALQPTGSGTLEAAGLVPLLQDLGNAGIIPPHTAQAAAGVLTLLGAAQSGSAQSGAIESGAAQDGATRIGRVRLPIDVADGRLAVAGIPLLRLPAPPWLQTPPP